MPDINIAELEHALRHAYIRVKCTDFVGYLEPSHAEILVLIPEEDQLTQKKYLARHLVVAINGDKILYSKIDLNAFMRAFDNFKENQKRSAHEAQNN